MTDPVILYGTQSNGETLPVQVDDFGRLVAEGLQGAKGDPGEPGAEGPQGPEGPQGQPGTGIPLDGTEGDVLTWIDGAPQWASQGPTDIVWPNYVTAPTGWMPGSNSYIIFDGTDAQAATNDAGGLVLFEFPEDTSIVSFGMNTSNTTTTERYRYTFNDITGDITDTGGGGNTMLFHGLAGLQMTAGDTVTIQRVSSFYNTTVRSFTLNGEELVWAPALRMHIRREVAMAIAEARSNSLAESSES